MIVKVCRTCLVEKPIDEFHTDRAKKDGYRNSCKPCTLNRQYERRAALDAGAPPLRLPITVEEKKERKRAYDLERTLERRAQRRTELNYDNWTVAERAYLAGMIDGEGSITLTENRICVQLNLSISMTHRPTIEWLAEIFQTKVYDVKRGGQIPLIWKQQYSVKVVGRRAAEVLETVLPYMITKREQALVGIEFGKTLGIGTLDAPWGHLGDEMRAKRYELKERLHALNGDRRPHRKGKKPNVAHPHTRELP